MVARHRKGATAEPLLLLLHYVRIMTSDCFIIIIIDSMTSVLNTDASLPYNHDLFESPIVKKKNKDGRGGDLLLPYYNHSEVPTPPNTHSGSGYGDGRNQRLSLLRLAASADDGMAHPVGSRKLPGSILVVGLNWEVDARNECELTQTTSGRSHFSGTQVNRWRKVPLGKAGVAENGGLIGSLRNPSDRIQDKIHLGARELSFSPKSFTVHIFDTLIIYCDFVVSLQNRLGKSKLVPNITAGIEAFQSNNACNENCRRYEEPNIQCPLATASEICDWSERQPTTFMVKFCCPAMFARFLPMWVRLVLSSVAGGQRRIFTVGYLKHFCATGHRSGPPVPWTSSNALVSHIKCLNFRSRQRQINALLTKPVIPPSVCVNSPEQVDQDKKRTIEASVESTNAVPFGSDRMVSNVLDLSGFGFQQNTLCVLLLPRSSSDDYWLEPADQHPIMVVEQLDCKRLISSLGEITSALLVEVLCGISFVRTSIRVDFGLSCVVGVNSPSDVLARLVEWT
ncbi:hypothetical protein CLF_108427 [Clonorchis sinensis]|uniref:Uncharacterized protein n=1 Tax=Clonorchis sinensis TaxID=79923 RepID=G7YI15_CLOSI|nr:hypothetical protein CLF_108427 [Clonorchis sinensis]